MQGSTSVKHERESIARECVAREHRRAYRAARKKIKKRKKETSRLLDRVVAAHIFASTVGYDLHSSQILKRQLQTLINELEWLYNYDNVDAYFYHAQCLERAQRLLFCRYWDPETEKLINWYLNGVFSFLRKDSLFILTSKSGSPASIEVNVYEMSRRIQRIKPPDGISPVSGVV